MRIGIARPLSIVTLLLAAGIAPALAQQAPPAGGGPPPGPPPAPLQLSSTAFADSTKIPEKYTCAAGLSKMMSPPLQWVNTPKGTVSFVLLLHDPDAHARKSFNDITHWMIFNIAGDATSLPENVTPDSTVGVQANNIIGRPQFFGSCAPPGPDHHYTYELFALDTKLDLQKGASRDDVQKAMDGHVLAGTVLIGLFHRTTGGPPPQ